MVLTLFSSNIGNVVKALWRAHDDTVSEAFVIKNQQLHVSILSLCSFFGRLLSGKLYSPSITRADVHMSYAHLQELDPTSSSRSCTPIASGVSSPPAQSSPWPKSSPCPSRTPTYSASSRAPLVSRTASCSACSPPSSPRLLASTGLAKTGVSSPSRPPSRATFSTSSMGGCMTLTAPLPPAASRCAAMAWSATDPRT